MRKKPALIKSSWSPTHSGTGEKDALMIGLEILSRKKALLEQSVDFEEQRGYVGLRRVVL